jgi:RNA polymerase sigma factor (sigma-70 family)
MSHTVIRDYLRTAVSRETAGPADAELLARFAAARDETAFELLVWRHAALIQRICRGVLRNHHAAEDAAQATFLVLARKAHTFGGRGSVVGWLYKVARRVAIRLAKQQARSTAVPMPLEDVAVERKSTDLAPDEVAALWTEVDNLPEKYRIPVLLCYFEGLTHAEASRRTGWAIGTVSGRLARAKEILARRLSRKGLGLCAVTLALPAGTFVGSTAWAAVAFAGRETIIPGIEPSVSLLAEGALRAMTTLELKFASTLAALILASTAILGWSGADVGQDTSKPAAGVEPAIPVLKADPASGLPSPTPQVVPPAPGAPPAPGVLPGAAPSAALPRPPVPVPDQPTRPSPPLAVRMEVSKNCLKQIMLAMHNYHGNLGSFPNDIEDRQGKPLLSWRVAILPYIQQDALYKQFRLDEPWDSVHNKKLLARMPQIYRGGLDDDSSSKTQFQVFAGKGTPFERGKKIKIADITDGTSNTLGVVESGPPVEWTKPDDLTYDPEAPLPRMELPYKKAFLASTMDGAVHLLRGDLKERMLRNLIERNDGNFIDKDIHARLALTREDLTTALDMLKKNEKTLEGMAEQVREQQKFVQFLLATQAIDPKSIEGLDLGQLTTPLQDLTSQLEHSKKETESLRRLVDRARRK